MLRLLMYCSVPAVIVFLIRQFRASTWGRCRNTVKLSQKVVIVTGANSGIGYEIAKDLAKRGAHVILACRSLEKGKEAVDLIKKQVISDCSLIPMVLDLSSLKSVRDFAIQINATYDSVDILVNNAGVSFPRNERHVTTDGFEIHFGVNYLGHFYLTKLLLDKLKSKKSRVVIVASILLEKGVIDLNHLNNLDPKISTNLYANSKLANTYFCRELAKRMKGTGITTYAACPGWVYTSLSRNSIKWYHYILAAPVALFFMRSPKQGSQTPIFCATEPDLEKENGFIYRDCKHYKSKFAFDDNISSRLWQNSEEMIDNVIKAL